MSFGRLGSLGRGFGRMGSARAGGGTDPLPPVLPSIDAVTLGGIPRIGETLTATPVGVINGGDDAAVVSYVWQRGGTPIEGATSAGYTLTNDDWAEQITCEATITNSAGSDNAESDPTAEVYYPTLPADHLLAVLHETPSDPAVFAGWAGVAPALGGIVIPHNETWGTVVGTLDAMIGWWGGTNLSMIWSVPFCFEGTTMASTIDGDHDAELTAIAEAIIAAAPPTGLILIRPDWEMNFPSEWNPWPWGAHGHEAEAIALWRHGVRVFRSVEGGERFRFVWCLALNPPSTDPMPNIYAMHPGRAYAEVVDADIYYMQSQGPVPGVVDPAEAFETIRDMTHGLNELVAFAVSQDCSFGSSEWGLDFDKPEFVTLLAEWFDENPVAYQCYLDWDLPGIGYLCRLSDDWHGMWGTGAAYITAFGVPTWGANIVTSTPNAVDGSWYNSSVTNSGNRVTGDGAVNYGFRGWDGQGVAGALPAGRYQVQIGYKHVSPNAKAFGQWFLSAPFEQAALFFTGDTLDTEFPGGLAEHVSARDAKGDRLITFEVDTAGGTGFSPGFGPGNATSGSAIDFWAMRVRPAA